jgi:hypothetical protein
METKKHECDCFQFYVLMLDVINNVGNWQPIPFADTAKITPAITTKETPI